MALNKRKATTAIVAGVTAAALLLGGTFAWTSISQQARNEAIVDINPGGRLHDDFNGTNKDVYVENFGDEQTGVPIFARIRLYEYMEIGQQAGDKTADDKKANSLIDGDTINDIASWEIYKYNTESEFTKYWDWTLGNNDENTLPYYMPTFNMNKDSLAADINGTYEGTVEDDIVHYDDYTPYVEGSTKTETEVYDHDSNTNEEAEGTVAEGFPAYATTDPNAPIDDAHVRLNENVTHTATRLSTTSTVMSMEEWMEAGSPVGPIWVFDADGWAYWAQPILPGKTTGLLLDGIRMTRVPDDSWYYGINVVAQFATEGDIGAFGNGATEEQTWTADAENLFATISNAQTLTIDGADRVVPGGNATFTATRTVGGVQASLPALTWTAADADGQAIDGVEILDGYLTVADTVADGTQITVTATADGETALSATKIVTVKTIPVFAYTLTDGDGVAVDSVWSDPWLSCEVANEDGETLLLTVNRNIDLDATLSHDVTTTQDSGVTVTMDEDTDGEDTLRITFSNSYIRGMGFDSTVGMTRPLVRLTLVTEYEDAVYVDFMMKPTQEDLLVLTVNGVEFDGTTALNNGDVFTLTYNGTETYVFHCDFLTEGIVPGTFGTYADTIYVDYTDDGRVLYVSESVETQAVDMGITYYDEDGTFCYKKFTGVTVTQPSADETT